MGRPKSGGDQEAPATSRTFAPTAPATSQPFAPSAPATSPTFAPSASATSWTFAPTAPVASHEPQRKSPVVVQANGAPVPGVSAHLSPAPPLPMMNHNVGVPWSSGLFDCNLDQTNAVTTTFFPCVTFGQTAEILDSGQTTCLIGSLLYVLLAPALCSCWILGSGQRKKLRSRYNLVEAPFEDWAVHLFCPCCALCQEFRELKCRGTDPSLGYLGNVALQNARTEAPKVQQMEM